MMVSLNTNYSPSAQKQQDISFGMLFMNEKNLIKGLGEFAAKKAENVRLQLKAKANNVDIFVQPGGIPLLKKWFIIYVKDIVSPPKNSDSIIKKIIYWMDINSQPYKKGRVFIRDYDNIGNNLLHKTDSAKERFLTSKHKKKSH